MDVIFEVLPYEKKERGEKENISCAYMLPYRNVSKELRARPCRVPCSAEFDMASGNLFRLT